MPIKPASFSILNSVSQSLFKSIELENALPPALDASLESFQQYTKTFDPEEFIDAILQTLDLLKQRLCEQVARICQRHNSLLPIQRLPPEILSACITHDMAEIESHNHHRRLIHLSTVSQWWRTVAIGTPSLWSVVSSKDPEWIISLALSRSKDAPLVVVSEDSSNCRVLYGPGLKYRPSIGSEKLFNLVAQHSSRWCEATLPNLKRSSCTKGIQLSQRLRRLTLSGSGSPTMEDPITHFSGSTERLLELQLHQLVISPKDIIYILSFSHQMSSLDLQSLVVPAGEQLPDDTDDASLAFDLPCLTSLTLKHISSSILYPVVQSVNPSTLKTVHIIHDPTAQGNAFPDGNKSRDDPFASFIARVAATEKWFYIDLQQNRTVVRRRSSKSRLQYTIDLLGAHSVLLPWLRSHSLPQVPQNSSMELYIGIDALGENAEQAVIETLKQLRVASVCLRGPRESWRWMWLLSLPDAVTRDASASPKPIQSWLWPNLRYLNIHGDFVDEFTLLNSLLARYRSTSSRELSTSPEGMPHRLRRLEVRPGGKVWRGDVFDKIKELVKPGYFKWVVPK